MGAAAKLPKKPGIQKLTPLSSAAAIVGALMSTPRTKTNCLSLERVIPRPPNNWESRHLIKGVRAALANSVARKGGPVAQMSHRVAQHAGDATRHEQPRAPRAIRPPRLAASSRWPPVWRGTGGRWRAASEAREQQRAAAKANSRRSAGASTSTRSRESYATR